MKVMMSEVLHEVVREEQTGDQGDVDVRDEREYEDVERGDVEHDQEVVNQVTAHKK